jgi:hypothetical protein
VLRCDRNPVIHPRVNVVVREVGIGKRRQETYTWRHHTDDDKRRLEAQKEFLERLRDKSGAEADYQQAIADYATARTAECGAEFSVIGLGDLGDANTRGSASARAAQLKLNDALRARAGAGSGLADREKSLCDRRKAAYDSWLKLGR